MLPILRYAVGGSHFIFSSLYFTVWGVEPVVPHQTSWLESTGVCGVQQNQAGECPVRKTERQSALP